MVARAAVSHMTRTQHYYQLLRKHNVRWLDRREARGWDWFDLRRGRSLAFPESKQVALARQPYECGEAYMTALHEIGHCVLRHRGRAKRTLWKHECEAWAWAFKNNKCVSERIAYPYAMACLLTYL